MVRPTLSLLSYFGSVRTEDGIGLAAKLNLQALSTHLSPDDIDIYVLSRPVSHQNPLLSSEHFIDMISDHQINLTSSKVNYLHFSPRWCGHYLSKVSPHILGMKCNIGYWVCETPLINPSWLDMAHLYCEIWTSSEFCRQIYQRHLDIPVYVIPHPVPLRPISPRIIARKTGQLSTPFTVLTIANAFSDLKRKNVAGVISAFKLAFQNPDPTEARLVVKLTNVDSDLVEYNIIRTLAAGRDDIIIIDQHYPPHLIDKLYEEADLYVSLHRSEGFGITIADALSRGIPAISTNYSGSTDFASYSPDLLVRYSLVPVGEDRLRYSKNDIWAEPDISDAAFRIKLVFSRHKEYIDHTSNYREVLLGNYSMDSIGSLMAKRLECYL